MFGHDFNSDDVGVRVLQMILVPAVWKGRMKDWSGLDRKSGDKE